MTVTAQQIRMTSARLDAGIIRTPMLESPMLSRHLGCELFLKLECLQYTSSFKARGDVGPGEQLVRRPVELRVGRNVHGGDACRGVHERPKLKRQVRLANRK